MTGYENGMPASSVAEGSWITASNPNGGNCVELAQLSSGEVAVRNSRYPDGPALVFTRAEVQAMLAGARRGEFDSLVG